MLTLQMGVLGLSVMFLIVLFGRTENARRIDQFIPYLIWAAFGSTFTAAAGLISQSVHLWVAICLVAIAVFFAFWYERPEVLKESSNVHI